MTKKSCNSKRVGYLLTLVIFASLLSLSASAECIVPQNGMVLLQSATLCEQEYTLPYGIVVGAEGVELDCNHAIIKGFGFGAGILVDGFSSATIRNCGIENYEQGIFLKKSSNNIISDNDLKNNINGIALLDSGNNQFKNINDLSIESSFVYYDESDFLDNDLNNYNEPSEPTPDAEDTSIGDLPDTTPETDPLTYTVASSSESPPELIPNDLAQVDGLFLSRASDQKYASQGVIIEKTRQVTGGMTHYVTKITATRDIDGLVLYEFFPKELVESAKDIDFDQLMILVEDDPILKKEIGDLNQGDVVVISYDLDKAVAGDLNPSSVVTIENSTGLIRALSSISYILALYLVLVLIKRYKADRMIKGIRAKSKKLLGVPFPITYIVLSVIPQINYRVLVSENIALLFYVLIIIVLLFIINHMVAKHTKI